MILNFVLFVPSVVILPFAFSLWRSRARVFVLALMIVMFVTSSSEAVERVRIALSVRNVVFLPFYYAKDTKIFDRHGLDVPGATETIHGHL